MSITVSPFCEPCLERKSSIESTKWCTDCEESLCNTCANIHLSMKATKKHHILDVSIAHSLPPHSLSGIRSCEKHEGFHYEFFCEDHQTLCCHECITSELHRSCRKMSTIDAVSRNVKTSQLYKNVENEVGHILETLTDIAKDREQNAVDIHSHVENAKKSIASLKSSIINNLDSMEKAILDDLRRMEREIEDKMQDENDQAKKEIEVVKVYQNQFNFVTKHGSKLQIFVFLQKLQTTLQELNDRLLGKLARMGSVSVEHKIPETMMASLSLGSIVAKEAPCTEKFKLNYQDFKLYRNFKLCGEIDLTTIDKAAFITGMAVWNDKLLLCNCDWNHHIPKVLVCNKDGKLMTNIDMNGAPWDVAILPGVDKAVAVLPNKNSIQFIDLNKNAPGKEIKMTGSDEKRGIAATEDRIFVGGLDRFIYVLDFEGNLLSTIFVRGEKFCYLVTVGNGDLIYSDFKGIHRIKLDGTEVYVFTSPELRNPKKVTTDQLGNLYIAGKDSHNIYRLTPDGTCLDVILKGHDKIHHPRAICFDEISNKLFITNHSGRELLIYQCT